METIADSKPRVTIFTNFFSYDPAYSLIRVTEDQIKMLNRHGYEPHVIVSESFEPEGEFKNCVLEKIPNVPCHNEITKDETFDQDILAIKEKLKKYLKDVNVCITQDIVYKPSELKYQLALRKLIQEDDKYAQIRYLHWINSATPPIVLSNLMGIMEEQYLSIFSTPLPNSFYVFFNDISKGVIAKNFNVTESDVRIVHHPSDLDEVYGVKDANLKRFIQKREIYQADAICIYPIRLDRGKQVQFPIQTMASLKDLGFDVRCIIVDFHSSGGDKVTYRDELKQIALDWGLTPKEIAFTSDFCDDWRVGMTHENVLALFRMSNVFVMSSVSESYSLVTQEAALTKNIIVLNQDFPPFRDIFGKDAIFAKYSSNWDVMAGYDEAYGDGSNTTTTYKNDKAYHKAIAAKIGDRLLNDIGFAMQIKIRKERNLDYIFKKELEPLLYV